MPCYLSRSKAAAHLDVHPTTIDRWADAGHITKHTIGSRVVFDRDELNVFAGRDVELNEEKRAVIRAAKKAGVTLNAISVAVGLSEQIIAEV